MTAAYICPACGSPVEITGTEDVIICPSCGTELTVDTESGRLLPVLAASVPGAPEDPLADEPLSDEPSEEPLITEPPVEPEPAGPPRGAEVFDSPEIIEPGPQTPVPPPPGRRTNPWLIGGLIALLVICIACLCLIAILALFFPATWEQFSLWLPAAGAIGI